MNRDDIIRMAREKSNAILLDLIGKPEWDKGCTEQHLIDFAALVASAEREACAKICEEHSTWTGRMCAETIKARG